MLPRKCYVVFDNQYWPRVIKYIWSAALPVGSRFANPLYGRGIVVVLWSGSVEREKWQAEEVNFTTIIQNSSPPVPENSRALAS